MKRLLIVVDYQNDFVNGSLGFENAKKIDSYIASLIKQFHQNQDDVIFTYDSHETNYLNTQEGKNLPIAHCIRKTDGWNLYGKVAQEKNKNDLCIYKNTFGSLELGNILKDTRYLDITIVGIVSNICVLSNAIIVKSDLPEVPIYIDKKGIASNDLDLQEKTIEILENLQFKVKNK